MVVKKGNSFTGLIWPPINPSQPFPLAVAMLAKMECLPLPLVQAGQMQQLSILMAHASKTSAVTLKRCGDASDMQRPWTFDRLRDLPILTRRDFQLAGDSLFNNQIPSSHNPVAKAHTSGTTGVSVTVRRTILSSWFYLAATWRDHVWWKRDTSQRLAIIRAKVNPKIQHHDNWGQPASLMGPSGKTLVLSSDLNVAEMAHELLAFQPEHLLIYPNQLRELDRYFNTSKPLESLHHIRTYGERVLPEFRQEISDKWQVSMADIYSTTELGMIAIECPVSGQYHVMADNLIVEILDPQGEPCEVGEIGNVVVTDLHNFATPLIRYEVGDQAEVGEPCSCGCQWPTLRRIWGRVSHMIKHPDGTRRWAWYHNFREIAPSIIQYQITQTSLHEMEFALWAEQPLSAPEEEQLALSLQDCFGYPFRVHICYREGAFERGPTGKFDEFICLF